MNISYLSYAEILLSSHTAGSPVSHVLIAKGIISHMFAGLVRYILECLISQ